MDTDAALWTGVTMRYRRYGDPGAPPVLLLHGGGSSAATWDRLAAALAAAGHHAIAPDLRGHGGSSRMPAYPLDGYRDDVLALLDALAVERLAVVGHSLGAHTATLIAQRQPSRVSRLVLEEPPAAISPTRFLLPALSLLAARRGFDRTAVTSAVRQLRAPDPAWWTRLSAITADTLLISGGPRSHIPPRSLAEMTGLIPRARLLTIPVGHRVHTHAPRRFHDAVIPFLAASGHR